MTSSESKSRHAEALVTRVTSAISMLAALSVLALAGIVFISVFFRYFLKMPMISAEDTMSFALALLVFAAYPYVTEERKHVQMDLLVELFRRFPRLDRARLILIDLVVIGMIGFVAVRLLQQAAKFAQRGSSTSSMQLPLWPLAAACGVLAAIAVLALIVRIVIEMRSAAWGRGRS